MSHCRTSNHVGGNIPARTVRRPGSGRAPFSPRGRVQRRDELAWAGATPRPRVAGAIPTPSAARVSRHVLNVLRTPRGCARFDVQRRSCAPARRGRGGALDCGNCADAANALIPDMRHRRAAAHSRTPTLPLGASSVAMRVRRVALSGAQVRRSEITPGSAHLATLEGGRDRLRSAVPAHAGRPGWRKIRGSARSSRGRAWRPDGGTPRVLARAGRFGRWATQAARRRAAPEVRQAHPGSRRRLSPRR